MVGRSEFFLSFPLPFLFVDILIFTFFGWYGSAKVLHETIRKTYGIHTALLPIFSASKTALNPQPKANGLNLLWPSLPLPTSPVISFSSSNNTGLSGNGNAVEKEKEMEAMEIGNELSEGDLKAIRIFLRELVVQSLIPFMERSILVGNEQVCLLLFSSLFSLPSS